MIPDFVIAGAPKSGTTTLHKYLSLHPDVYMASVKEPHFFCSDLPGLRVVTTDDAYRALFQGAAKGQITGEASASYLQSTVALRDLRAWNANVRVIVVLRNPVDAAYAFHSELLYNRSENLSSFAAAWAAQERRRSGHGIPAECREPSTLQYREVYAYAEQLARLNHLIPAAQTLLLPFSDLRSQPGAVCRRVLAFLGLDHSFGPELPQSNPNKQLRSARAARFVDSARRRSGRGYVSLKALANRFGIHPSQIMERYNVVESERPEMDSELHARLTEVFEEDIAASRQPRLQEPS